MIFANAMNSVSLAADRLEAEIGRDIEYNQARNIAFRASLIPITNSLFAVGLVSIPGMMTGQILSGVSPAYRCQVPDHGHVHGIWRSRNFFCLFSATGQAGLYERVVHLIKTGSEFSWSMKLVQDPLSLLEIYALLHGII